MKTQAQGPSESSTLCDPWSHAQEAEPAQVCVFVKIHYIQVSAACYTLIILQWGWFLNFSSQEPKLYHS